MRKLFQFFIDRPLVVKLMMLLILIVGFVFTFTIKREGLPKVDMREVHITTIYPGASPEDVELNVTIPIEDGLKGVSGIKEMKSTSMENLSRIVLVLDPDASDLEKVKRDIRRAVDTVDDLPREIKDRPSVWEMKVQNFAVIEVAFSSRKLNERQLTLRAKAFKKRLERLDRVSRVDSVGIRDREIQIKVDLNKLNARFLSFSDIITAIQSRNINLAGGNLESYVDEKGIITVSRFESIADVENIILRSNFEGNQVLLRDVARVVDTFERRTSYIRYSGADGVALQVVKKENADIIRTISMIKDLVRKFEKSPAGKGVRIHFLNDMSTDTRSRLSIVISNAVIGLVLVVLILFVFLNRRIAFWTALGLPVSILMSVVAMAVMGITINMISLSGIIIVMGMLVDDAIIIAENIFRYRRNGMSWKDAALEGVQEVASPVVATVLTTIIAFIPILFMSGSVADFTKDIPVVIGLVLLASLFEGFFILPQHLSHTRRPDSGKSAVKEESRIAVAFFSFLDRIYRPMISFSLRRRYLLLLIFILVLVGSFGYMATSMKFLMFDPDQSILFWIDGQTRRGSSLQKTSNDIRRIEELLKMFKKGSVPSIIEERAFEVFVLGGLKEKVERYQLKKFYTKGPDRLYRLRKNLSAREKEGIEKLLIKSGVKRNVVESFKSQVGLGLWGTSEDPNFFNIIVYLTPANSRQMRAADLVALLRQQVRRLTEIKKTFFVIDSGGPPVGRELEVKLTGEDDGQRQAALKYLQAYFRVPETVPAKVFREKVLGAARKRSVDISLLNAAYALKGAERRLKKDLEKDLAADRFSSIFLRAVSGKERRLVRKAFRRAVPVSIPEISFRYVILEQLKKAEERDLLLRSYAFDSEKKVYRFKSVRAEKDVGALASLLRRCGYTFKDRYVLRAGIAAGRRKKVLDVIHRSGYILREERGRLRVLMDRAGLMLNGIYDIDHDYETGKDEMRVGLNYRRIARFGLQAVQVAQAIRTAYNGTVVTWKQTQNEKVEYRVLLDDRYRKGKWTLDRLKINNREGRLVPIRNLLRIREQKSVKRIHHFDRDRVITLSANIRKDVITPIEVFRRLKKLVPALERKFPGVTVLVKGEAEESAKTFASLGMALMVAVVAVYFLLVLLFNSFTQPYMVLLAIPFGMIGVIVAFGVHGMNMSLMAALGIIGLSGVVVNDSLVMIDFINKMAIREPKRPLMEVVMEGARLRIRPIFLTTLTTCAGLFPTAYGIGGYDSQIAPMTMALAWGLVFATLLTLLLIPALYMIEKDIRRAAGRAGKALRGLFHRAK